MLTSLLAIWVTNWIIGKIFRLVLRSVKGRIQQFLVLLIVFVLFFHGYYLFFLKSSDLYGAVGLSHRASSYDVRRRFRDLFRENHPDRHPDRTKTYEHYAQINEVLGSQEHRWLYNRFDLSIEHLTRNQ